MGNIRIKDCSSGGTLNVRSIFVVPMGSRDVVIGFNSLKCCFGLEILLVLHRKKGEKSHTLAHFVLQCLIVFGGPAESKGAIVVNAPLNVLSLKFPAPSP